MLGKKQRLNNFHVLILAALTLLTITSPVWAQTNTAPTTSLPTLTEQLLGAGSRWAANNGTSALLIDWKDNYLDNYQANPTWGPWPTQTDMNNSQIALTNLLEDYGFTVTTAGDIPSDLTPYSLVVIQAYYACEPQYSQLISNYINNGGGVVLLSGVPLYFSAYAKSLWVYDNTTLETIEPWFGAQQYLNTGGDATAAISYPFNLQITAGQTVFSILATSAAAIGTLGNNSQPIAYWNTGSLFAFTHEYGNGRLYYQADIDLSIIAPRPYQPTLAPTLTLSCVSSTYSSSFNVQINGNLSWNGTALVNMPIQLSYSVTNEQSWQPLTLVNTDTSGNFTAEWLPTVTGDYLINATYAGNAIYSSSTTVTSLIITPPIPDTQTVFSVVSNSTVSDLTFNSTSGQLSFIVSGPTGTKGYADVYVAKSLINDTSTITAYIDGNRTSYTLTSTADSWILHFIYHHSTHKIVLKLNQNQENSSGQLTTEILAVGGAVAAAVIVTATIMVYYIHRSLKNLRKQ